MERGVKYIWKLIETIPVRHCSPAANMGSLRKRGAAARFSPNPSLFNIHPIFPRYSLSESITRSVAIHGKFRWFSSGGEESGEKGAELYRVTEINCPRLSCTGLTNVSGNDRAKTKTNG